MRIMRRVEDSATSTVHGVRMTHMNAAGRLFGGTLLEWIDEVGMMVAKKHARMNITLASIEHLQFIRGAYLDHMVVLEGKLVFVGRSSMDIKVDSYVEDEDGQRTLINTAYMTFVALNTDDVPTEVPGLILETDEQRKEWEKGEKRRILKLENRYRKEHHLPEIEEEV